ncbi:MAG TPA: GntR family transcriptional regulator [Streptosporangiaceae bacterium]|nr:GntR family transcriptional regulator [Streptosporangiaceae bacterium]
MDASPVSRGGEPLYAKIAAELREQIKDGTYGPGALLPSRNELAAMYSVSAITARDALAVLSHDGYARAIRGRGHIVRRKRPRLQVPSRMYAAAGPDGTMLDPAMTTLHRLDVYQEVAPDNIALPLECGADPVWVRRAVYIAAADRQPVQIHVSWLPGLDGDAGAVLCGLEPGVWWPQAVQQVTGRVIATVLQNTRARGANPFEADVFGVPGGTALFVAHLTTYDREHRPVEHSRFAWPVDAVRMSEEYPYALLPHHDPVPVASSRRKR